MLQFDVVTLFPPMFEAVTECGVTGRARDRGLYQLVLWNPREFAANAYRSVDDRPYGGGPRDGDDGRALVEVAGGGSAASEKFGVAAPRVIYLSPQGRLLEHAVVAELAREAGIVLLTGRYEGVDERLLRCHGIEEVSIGDYVLSGGELAAMVLIDSVVRQLPGALGDAESAEQDSFVRGLLDCPQYTRPETFEGAAVPPVLLSGNHAEIGRWRLKQALGRTWLRRPELLAKRELSAEERRLLDEFRNEAGATGA